eukprot:scaffold1767_cov64-Attheya_sp.AAC.2
MAMCSWDAYSCTKFCFPIINQVATVHDKRQTPTLSCLLTAIRPNQACCVLMSELYIIDFNYSLRLLQVATISPFIEIHYKIIPNRSMEGVKIISQQI